MQCWCVYVKKNKCDPCLVYSDAVCLPCVRAEVQFPSLLITTIYLEHARTEAVPSSSSLPASMPDDAADSVEHLDRGGPDLDELSHSFRGNPVLSASSAPPAVTTSSGADSTMAATIADRSSSSSSASDAFQADPPAVSVAASGLVRVCWVAISLLFEVVIFSKAHSIAVGGVVCVCVCFWCSYAAPTRHICVSVQRPEE
jgi:hypothetical protein